MLMKNYATRLERLVNNMTNLTKKMLNRKLRKARVRSTIIGTTARPRLCVVISNLNISAQIIDDSVGKTLISSTTVGKKMTGTISEKAAIIGAEIAKKAIKSKIKTIVFDRNGRVYAGRLNAFAEAARKEGLVF
jgi:large subunit ribosomal protein L18